MQGWSTPDEELRQADALRSRASLLRKLGADELAESFETLAVIAERKAYAMRSLNLPTETVLKHACRSKRN